MDIHYNAFISYRHHPQDIKVAEAIHRGLEHFHIPKALKKKKDTKLRLFRDKEELPITSNLSDDITRALHNSDFLIVICSTHTRESLWVQREIETFLQTHDHNRVLTVLVDGEPYDTIPEILCSMEEIDPATGQKQLIPIEPLSCDWRFGKRKAFREELPRLAAALLGCGYDELRQRQKQYRIRRMATAFGIAFSLVLAFTGYVIYNSIQLQKANDQLTQANIQIQNNLDAALVNQSQYLASASEQSLEEGDRMLALALAMEALPEYEGERPYVAQAEFALANAYGAYAADSQVGGVGKIACDSQIREFAVTDSRSRMFVMDERKMLGVWNLENYSNIRTVVTPGSNGNGEFMVTPEDQLVFLGQDYVLYGYDADLNLLWTREDCNEAAFTRDRNVVLAELNDNTVAFLDAATGQEVYPSVQVWLKPEDQQDYWHLTFRQDNYDLSKPVLMEYSQIGEDSRLIALDLQTGNLQEVASVPEGYDIRRTNYTSRGNVVVLAVSEAGLWNGNYGQMMTHSPVGIQVLCFSPQGEALWTANLTSYSYSTTHVLSTIEGRGELFCQVDNVLAMVDENTGTVISACETGATPVWTQMGKDSATILLEDGSMGMYYFDANEFNSTRYFKENIAQAYVGKGVFLRQSYTSEILVYTSIMDKNWQMFEGSYNPTAAHTALAGEYVATYNYDAICIFDVAARKHLWTIEEGTNDRFQLLEFSGDEQTLWFSNKAATVCAADVQTGQVTSYALPQTAPDGNGLYYSSFQRICMTEGVIYTQAENLGTDEIYVVAFDTRAREVSIVNICKPLTTASNDCEILTAWDNTVYLWEESHGAVFAGNTVTGEVGVWLEDAAFRPVVQLLDDSETYMLGVGDKVRFFCKDGTLLLELQLEETRAVSAFRLEEKLLLLTDDGSLTCYHLSGEKLAEMGTHLYTGFNSNVSGDFEPEEIRWDLTDDGSLMLNIFNSGNLIHLESFQIRAWAPNCVGYLPALDEIVTSQRDVAVLGEKMGVYPCYSTEMVIQMAQEALGSYCLTEEQREEYGIS